MRAVCRSRISYRIHFFDNRARKWVDHVKTIACPAGLMVIVFQAEVGNKTFFGYRVIANFVRLITYAQLRQSLVIFKVENSHGILFLLYSYQELWLRF